MSCKVSAKGSSLLLGKFELEQEQQEQTQLVQAPELVTGRGGKPMAVEAAVGLTEEGNTGGSV